MNDGINDDREDRRTPEYRIAALIGERDAAKANYENQLLRNVEIIYDKDGFEKRAEKAEASLASYYEREVDALVRRDKAEAACAAMREALEQARDWFLDHDDGGRLHGVMEKALEPDAGKGYVERKILEVKA